MTVRVATWLRLALPSAMLAGCAAPAPVTIQTFRSAPAAWSTLSGEPVSPASLKVERGHLDLGGNAVYFDTAVLGDFSAIADVALTGGDARGLAGIFAFEPGSVDRICACVAVRPGGEWRAYRAKNPLEPQGGRGWKASGRSSPAGFFRLGITAAVGEVRLSVDGNEVDRCSGESAPGGTRAPGAWSGLRFGLFSIGAASRWKNFIAGGASGGEAFRPEAYVYWGDRSDAEALLLEARSAAKTLSARASRMGIYGTVAVLEEAYRAFLDSGGSGRAESVLELALRTEESSKEGARGIGEGDLHERAFAGLAALDSRPAARGPISSEGANSTEARLAAIQGKRKPLRLDFTVENAAKQPVVSPADLSLAVRESYGGLERASGGELRIRARVDRSANDAESTESERKVPVGAKRSRRLAEVEADLAALEKRLPEKLLDAETRANVVRGAANVLGPGSLVVLRSFQLGDKAIELHVDDGDDLEKAYAKLSALRVERRKLQGSQPADYRRIPATLHTNSILVEVSYSVELDGKAILNVPRERTYLGIEQWTHPADEATGTPASRSSDARVAEAVSDVRSRVLSRFRTAVSRDNVLAKIEPGLRFDFLVRLARATREEEDLSNLQWYLKNDLKLEGTALERATRSLLE